MNTIWKEIRVVGLKFHVPNGMVLDEWLCELEKERPSCKIIYDRSNTKDPNCMIAKVGNVVLGVVNFDDKRFIKHLLDKNGYCNAGFIEVYKEDDSPILRFRACVELDKVEKITAGKEWDHWSFPGHILKMPQEWNDVDYSARMIIEMLDNPSNPIDPQNMEEMVQLLCHSSRYDMSVELSQHFDRICCCLESIHSTESEKWKNKLQRACTKRRQDKSRLLFISEWLPNFMSSKTCINFLKEYSMWMLSSKDSYDKPLEKSDYSNERNKIEKYLRELPYNLYYYIYDYSDLFASSIYTLIPRIKQLQLLSLLIVRDWLDSLLNSASSLSEQMRSYGSPSFNIFGGVENMTIGNNAQLKGGINVLGDLLTDNATKVATI